MTDYLQQVAPWAQRLYVLFQEAAAMNCHSPDLKVSHSSGTDTCQHQHPQLRAPSRARALVLLKRVSLRTETDAARPAEGHHLHQDLRRGAALPQRPRFTSEILPEFRGRRRGGGGHGQTDGEVPGIRLRDHGGPGGSRESVQRCESNHRWQEGERQPGVSGSKTSQRCNRCVCWSPAGPADVGTEALWADAAVLLPPDLPPAQPGAAPSGQPRRILPHPLPGLQRHLLAFYTRRTATVPLPPLTVAPWWLLQLQLLPRACSPSLSRPLLCRPPSSRCPQGLPALPPAPARPHVLAG